MLAKQRFTAGETNLLYTKAQENADQTLNFLKRKQFRVREELMLGVELLLGHAVAATEIAVIGKRNAQVSQGAPALVNQMTVFKPNAPRDRHRKAHGGTCL